MNIQEEKLYIYEMMKNITQERRNLTEQYYGLKERLDFLHKQEEKGLDDLSLKGYVDLYNETQKQIAITNIKRESNHIIERIEKSEEKQEEIIPKEEILREKEYIINKKEKRTGKLNRDKVISQIVSILKENGAPMKKENILTALNQVSEIEITKFNFSNNILPLAVQKNEKIEKAARGYYQYKF